MLPNDRANKYTVIIKSKTLHHLQINIYQYELLGLNPEVIKWEWQWEN